ncbi:MAG: GAF domain-containing protein [Clostridiales bacterium]|nr:GAF domain-containing protein [Clostridiales bacterium]
MKKQRSDSKLIRAVYIMCLVQVIYFAVYAYVTREETTGVLSLFTLILAVEFFALAGYAASVIKRFLSLTVISVLSLKNKDKALFVSSTFPEIDKAVTEIGETINKEREIYEKKIKLIATCTENPVAADLFDICLPLILEITGANACAYYYVNNGTKKLELMKAFGFSQKIYKVFDIEIGEGLEGACCKSMKTSFLSEDIKDDRYTSVTAHTNVVFQNVMAVPVKGKDGCVGVLTLAYKNTIHKTNIDAAEETAALLEPIHYNNSRYERYRRQKNEIKLQNTLIEDIMEELKKKNEEIEKLKNRIALLEDSGE